MDEQLILNRYRLIERLAVGGSAEVWRAHDEQLDRPVAVKRLHPHLLPDEASRRRLAAEARAAASLSHPGIVAVYDVDATGGAPALVMELVDGESLSARIDREGPLPARQAAAVAADVAEALYHAHQRGVVHRDVKPGNVLLGTDGRTRLVDFGIAHSLADSAARFTLPGTVIGTLRAMAPEQLAGGPITPRTDLYGLGVVLHEALTGRPPYPGGSPLELAKQQGAGPPNLDELEPALAALVVSCLAHDPADRPLHARALASASRDWLAGDPSTALAMAPSRAPVPVDTAAVTQPIPVVSPAPRAAARSAAAASVTRRHWPVAALAALATLLLVVLAVVTASDRGPGGDAVGGEPTPTAAASMAPTPVAPTPVEGGDWITALVGKVARQCDDEIAEAAEAEMAEMTEQEAGSYADEQIRACREARRGSGNGRVNDD